MDNVIIHKTPHGNLMEPIISFSESERLPFLLGPDQTRNIEEFLKSHIPDHYGNGYKSTFYWGAYPYAGHFASINDTDEHFWEHLTKGGEVHFYLNKGLRDECVMKVIFSQITGIHIKLSPDIDMFLPELRAKITPMNYEKFWETLRFIAPFLSAICNAQAVRDGYQLSLK